MVTATPCPRCGGTGEEIPSPCPDCRGEGRRREERSFVVDVPAGSTTGRRCGSRAGAPAAGAAGRPGTCTSTCGFGHHPTLTRRGADLLAVVHVAMTQAALGVGVPFETLDGVEELTIPAGTQSGREIRLRGRGVPHLQGRGRGDLIVTVVVDTPTDLSQGAGGPAPPAGRSPRGRGGSAGVRASCPSCAAPSSRPRPGPPRRRRPPERVCRRSRRRRPSRSGSGRPPTMP